MTRNIALYIKDNLENMEADTPMQRQDKIMDATDLAFNNTLLILRRVDYGWEAAAG